MKRMFFREIAALLVMARLVLMFSMAEDNTIELPDGASDYGDQAEAEVYTGGAFEVGL